jgi:hypothetical protein
MSVKKRLMLFIIIGLCTVVPVLAQQVGGLIDPGVAGLIVDRISGERAKGYVEKIAQFHRIRGGGPGSGYNEAVDYVMSEIDDIGLDEAHVERFLSDGFATYLRWQSPVGWRVKGAKLYLTHPRKRLLADFSHTAVSLMAYSSGGEAEASVVFVGDGNDDSDYAGVDVEGKIVFATGGDGNGVHRKAVLERGALGVVVGPSRRPDRFEYPDLVELKRLYFSGAERSQAGWGFSLTRRQSESIQNMLESGVEVRMHAEVEAELFDGEMPVISALIQGSRFPDQEILVMGHLDHYKPGANDNASGSAGMIEMAKVLLDLIETEQIPRPLRSIRFLWLPEMHGAMAYVDAHRDIGERTLVGINLDMIGEDYEKCKGHLVMTRPPYSNPSYLGDVVESMIQWVDRLNLFSERGSRNRLNYRDVGYSGGSDHVIFTDPTVGVPSLMLVHSDVFHHTSYDTPDKCDPTEMRRVITAATLSTYSIAYADDRAARRIALLTAVRGLGRIQNRTDFSLTMLENALKDGSTASKGPYAYRNALTYANVLTEVEKQAIHTTRQLCTTPEAKTFIESVASTLDRDLKSEKVRIKLFYNELCQLLGVNPKKYTLTSQEQLARRIKPERTFIGPLPRNYLFTGIGEDYDWYRENQMKIGGNLGSKTFEIANLANGERDLLKIRDVISAEFGETALEFVIHFAEDMKKIGLFTY